MAHNEEELRLEEGSGKASNFKPPLVTKIRGSVNPFIIKISRWCLKMETKKK
jgi:hypothetical protein